MTDYKSIISVEHISKKYRLGTINHGMLYRDMQSWWAKLCGKDDPNTIVDEIEKPIKTDAFLALDDISFTVKKGEVVGIIGSNGAGKSTLLKILTRVTAPTGGKISLHGRVASLLEVGTGFHPELTGRENIYLNGAILGMKKKEINHNFKEIVGFSEIEKFIDTPVKRYSSGMYIRLAFAVAAFLEPEILLIDEVLAVGDLRFQKKCLAKMDSISKKEGRTILFVSHSMAAIKNLCDRAILLKNGQLYRDGNVDDVISEYIEDNKTQGQVVATFPDNDKTKLFIRRVAVTDENGIPNGNFHINSRIFIEIDYVATQDLKDSFIIFAISKNGSYVYQSHDVDRDEKALLKRERGLYHAQIELPKRLLTAGNYSVSFSAAIGSSAEHGHDGHPDILDFTIEEEGEEISFKSYAKKRGMMVIAEIGWNVQKSSLN